MAQWSSSHQKRFLYQSSLSTASGMAVAMRAGRLSSVTPRTENHCQPLPRSLGSGEHTLTVADATPPTGTVIINGNASTTASSTVALALTWDDGLNGSGVSRIRFSNDGTTWSAYQAAAINRRIRVHDGQGGTEHA